MKIPVVFQVDTAAAEFVGFNFITLTLFHVPSFSLWDFSSAMGQDNTVTLSVLSRENCHQNSSGRGAAEVGKRAKEEKAVRQE